MKKTYQLATALSLALCAAILMFADHSSFLRGYGGDAVFVFLLYALAQCFGPFPPIRCLLGVLALCFAAEGAQYVHLIEFLGMEQSPFFRTLLGSVFDFRDLVAYTVGAGITALIDAGLRSRAKI